jgi:predicted nucleic acid-binding protein
MKYLDSSAIIKRFAKEKGSELVRRIIEEEGPIATAKIAYAEIHSGLAREKRERILTPAQYDRICRQFELDWLAYVRLELTDEVLLIARELIRRYPLRGFDAIHLASALILQTNLGEPITFAGADERQLQAAAQEKLAALNVETG